MLLFIYNLILYLLSPVLLLAYVLRVLLTGKEKNGFWQRLGFRLPQTDGCIWVHAVSVGESMAASAIVREIGSLFPGETLVVSTITDAGNAVAKKMIPQASHVFYLPLDFKPFVRHAIKKVKPKALIIVETELWPNFISEAKKSGAKTVLASGRISDKSLGKYQKYAFFFREVLSLFDVICMQGPEEVQKILSIGAPTQNVVVAGNAKLDMVFTEPGENEKASLRARMGLNGDKKLFVAGSTHPGEEKVLLDVQRKLLEKNANVRLLLVPRHIQRCDDIARLVHEAGLEAVKRTQAAGTSEKGRSETVFLLDTMGELQKFYSIADIVFVGGSLVPAGGHNVLEPVCFGKSVFCGPHMENFRGILDLLVPTGSVIQVPDGDALLEKIFDLLKNGEKYAAWGRNGKEIVEKNRGASRNIAFRVKELFTRGEMVPS